MDVRADLHAGREPFSNIMNAVEMLHPDETLRLITPFEPVPLFEFLGRQGFQPTARPVAKGDWAGLFTRPSSAARTDAKPAVLRAGGGDAVGRPLEIIELDARGLEPLQPLVTILEGLGRLPAHAELCARTDRRPMHLHAQLVTRGFTGESQEQSDGSFLTPIRHP